MSYINDNRRNQPVDAETDDAAGVSVDFLSEPELEAILQQLRKISLDIDAPPPIVAELARAAFETRDLDAELAVLTADSDVDVLELVRTAQVEPRMVSFETESVTVELQVEAGPDVDTVTVRGLVIGAVGQLVVDTGDQRIPAQLDERGWFLVEGVPAGALRLRIRGTDGGNVTTEWITT